VNIPANQSVYCVAVRGTQVFTGARGTFYMTDISNLQQPVSYNSCDITIGPQEIVLRDNYAFIVGGKVLQVVDITDPKNPTLLTELDGMGYCYDIAVKDHYAYVASSGLTVVDISDPSALVELSSYRPAGAKTLGITVYGNYIIAASNDRLQVLDLSDPVHPPVVCEVDGFNKAGKVSSAGNRVYVTDQYSGKLHVYEIDIPFPKTDLLSHVTWTDQWSSYLIVDNAGEQFCHGVLTLFEHGEVVVNRDLSVPPGLILSIPLNEGTNGKVAYHGDNVSMRASYVNNSQSGIAEFILDGFSSTQLNFLMPAYLSDQLTWMGVAIANPNSDAANLTMTAIGTNGSVLATSNQTINAFDRVVGVVAAFFPDLDYRELARIQVNSSREVSGINISGIENEKLLFTKAVGNTLASGADLTHIATAWNTWNNRLIIDNVGGSDVPTTLLLYQNGSELVSETITILANSTKVLWLNDYSHLNTDCGFLEFNSTDLAVRQSYESTTQGGTAEFFVNTPAVSRTIVYNFPAYIAEELNWMGLAIFNPSETTTTVTLDAYKNSEKVDSTIIDLTGFSRRAFLLSDLFPSTASNGIDRVVATSTNDLLGIYISGQDQNRLLFSPALNVNLSN